MKKLLSHNHLLLYFQIIAHAGFVYQLLNGSAFLWITSIIVYFITGCFGMTMTYHRLLSHKSWVAPNWFEKFGTLAGTWGLTGSSIGWVAIHREHHRFTDKIGDPHSPTQKGFFRVQFLSMFEKPNIKYVVDLIRKPFHAKIHQYYFYIHALIFFTLLMISPTVLISCYLAPAAMLWHGGSFINTLTHMVGYRNYETTDTSRNTWLLGLLMWGEGWHNNHHANPQNCSFKHHWWEIDIGGFFIKLLKK